MPEPRKPAPYGWRREASGELEEVPEEQEVIQHILDLAGIAEHYSAAVWSLNEWGLKTRRGANWRLESVRRVIETNPEAKQKWQAKYEEEQAERNRQCGEWDIPFPESSDNGGNTPGPESHAPFWLIGGK